MADASQKKLLNIFQEAQLEVPRYQRSYAWNEKQITDLLEDIEYVIERDKALTGNRDIVHYFGTVVLDDIREIESPAPSNWMLYEIVDGQQRLTTISLLVSCICEELKELSNVVQVDTARRSKPDQLAQKYRDIYVKYQNKENGQRLRPAALTQRAYEKLVIAEEDPDDLLEKEPVLPARKLAEGKQTIISWIKDLRAEYLSNGLSDSSQEELNDYYGYLEDVLSVVSNTFEVTRYRVDDTAEAGRLFEVVNDRGKVLTTAEKVKSHLLYCAGEVDELDAQTVARKFNEAIETITLQGGTEQQIDQFVERHWEIFTGETSRSRIRQDIDELHRRIKQIDRYAPLDREPEEDLVQWVETYVSTLKDAANAFVAIYDPDVLKDQYDDIDPQVIDKLYSIENSGAATNFRPLLMAAYIKLDPSSDEFSRLVRQCEVFSFRAYQVVGRVTTLLRRRLKQEAHLLYVSDRSEQEIRDLFGAKTADEYYGSPAKAVDEICDIIDNEIGRRAPENDFITYLKKRDVISGDFTTGWGGFTRKDTIKYLLYEYERDLREQEGDTGLRTLVGFSKFREDSELEHIAPVNPANDRAALPNHEENVGRLANIAFLWPDDNKSASNDVYSEKYNNTYESSGVKVLEELPSPPKKWDLDALDAREDDLVNFCLGRWSGETIAYVTTAEPVEEHIEEEIRDRVNSHFKHSRGGSVPTIKIQAGEPLDDSREDVESVRTCPDCNAVKMGLVNKDEFYCACGTALEGPIYQIESYNTKQGITRNTQGV
ncbi:DUF262 domain-containing protein [Halomicrobium salinisoli]|uniref:DUF262 domain-containing protein n=1 Tax=Halomicrobium salinisoli TaxID=2878391 RepID=UPI001CF000B2|nr:DUF262 domain-containing protein [Halomicrobium salinisoli]